MVAVKKNIDLELTAGEKQLLKTKGITQKSIRDYAIDEIAAILNASPDGQKYSLPYLNFKASRPWGSNLPKT